MGETRGGGVGGGGGARCERARERPSRLPSPLSAFAWLVALLATSLLLRPLAPLAGAAKAVLALAVAVAVDTATLRALWAGDRALLRALAAAAATSPAPTLPPTVGDATAIAACHGLAHGLTHASLMYLAWLPLAAGGRTLHAPACRHASLFGAGAAGAVATVLTHGGAAVVAFGGFDAGDARVWGRAPAAHAALGVASLVNRLPGGCLVGLPACLAVGVATAAAGARVAWRLATADGGRLWARPVGDAGEGGGGSG